jgi:ABC-type dipeptide/oligopeptide/nickel transport system permease subunit
MFRKKKLDLPETKGEISIEMVETAGLSQGKLVRRRFFRHRAAMASLIYLSILVLFVFSASGIHLGTKEEPFTIPGWWYLTISDLTELSIKNNADGSLLVGAPTLDLNPFDGNGVSFGEHPFGQDNIGRDYFALVVRGAQQSIMVMVVVGLIAAIVGTTIGAISGYFRGLTDSLLMRFTDLIITIPAVIVGAVIGARMGNLGVLPLAIFLGFFAWTGLARLVRGEFLTLREREFVDAARVAGASQGRIIFKHILPNAMGVIIVAVTLLLSGAILLETALSYVGFGVQSPDVSLGTLISLYQDSFQASPWLFWWPGFFIISIALSVNFIGDGLRDAFDPRQKRRITAKDRANARELKSTS